MEPQDTLKAIKEKAAETKKMTGLNGRHFAFKNWHATVLQLLKQLPSSYQPLVNDFKALTFEDTGYRRGRKFFSGPGNTRYIEDLEASKNILGKILKAKHAGERQESEKTASGSSKKPKRPPSASRGKKNSGKPGPKKAEPSGKNKKPAKKGSSAARKKKKS